VILIMGIRENDVYIYVLKRSFMRKHVCLLICIVTFLALLTGCKANDGGISVEHKESSEIEKVSSNQLVEVTDWDLSTYETVNNLDGVAMAVKKETATSTGLTVAMENNSSAQCIYDTD